MNYKLLTDTTAEKQNNKANKTSRTISSDVSKQLLHDLTIMNCTRGFIKQKSYSAIFENSKKSRQDHVNNPKPGTSNSKKNLDVAHMRHRTKSVSDIVYRPDISGDSYSSSPKVRVSSGSLFYSQVFAQQKLHAKQNPINHVKRVEKVYLNKKNSLFVFFEKQNFAFLEGFAKQNMLSIVCCQLCVNMYLYYLITTLECRVCV